MAAQQPAAATDRDVMNGRRATRWWRLLVAAAAAGVLATGAPMAANASWNSQKSATITASTATLQPPTNPSVTSNCGVFVLGVLQQSYANLSWTATTSTFATGYVLKTSLNGAAQPDVVITGRNTTTYAYPINRGVTYTYSIYATYQNWTSTTTAVPGNAYCFIL